MSSSQFHPYEFSELVVPTIQAETLTALQTPAVHALDVAHALAFRRGLGNSLFASPVGPVSAADVKSFASKAFAKDNLAIFGTGISTEALSEAITKAFGGASGSASGSQLSSSASKYYGGEQRIQLDLHAAEFNAASRPTQIIAFGTTDISSPELRVIPHILDGASSLKWVPGTKPLAIAASKIPGSKVSSFVLPYSDAALIGVEVSAPTSEGVKTLSKEVVELMKSLGAGSEEEVKKAVAAARFEQASQSENRLGLVASYGPRVLEGSAELQKVNFDQVSASSLAKVCTWFMSLKRRKLSHPLASYRLLVTSSSQSLPLSPSVTFPSCLLRE